MWLVIPPGISILDSRSLIKDLMCTWGEKRLRHVDRMMARTLLKCG